MTQPAIELRQVSKAFGKTEALKAMNLSVAAGECLVLAGPSGAGKTTLLRLVAGLEQPDRGDVLIDGRPVNGIGAWDRRVGMTFENYALYPHMSVRDNIAFPLRAKKPNDSVAISKRVSEIAEMLRIGQLLDRRTDQLSGGQRQRVALARCLVRDAAVYLLDEPLAHLDAKLRLAMRAEFKNMVRQLNATLIYVTHDYREAMVLGDRIAVIENGRLLQIGTPQQIFDEPATLFVARFVGDPPMNFIRATIRDGKISLDGVEGKPLDIRPGSKAAGAVWIGIRPMDCVGNGNSATGFAGVVKAVKLQQDGSGTVLAETPAGLVEATIEGTRPAFGDRIEVSFDAARALIFDGMNENLVGRILPAKESRTQ